MKTVLLLFFGIMTLSRASAEELSLWAKQTPDRPVTGNLRVDLFGQMELADVPPAIPDEGVTARHHRSPYIAGGLSLVVPGAGQIYTEHYWEAAAFLAADVAAWVLAAHYDKKGDNQTDFFQNYADGNWNVVQYADFTESRYLGTHQRAWLRPNTEGLPPWERVDWNVLNQMEETVGRTSLGQYYSHKLPVHGEQQYYELIGKYQQFYQGWNGADSALTDYYQITNKLNDPNVNMNYYSRERGKANDYYKNASRWVTLAIVNHVVNAVYAALSAGWYNSAHAELGMQRVPSDVGFTNVPVLKMSLDF